MSKMKRRNFIGLAASAPLAMSRAAAREDNLPLTRTPRDAEGPFYPKGARGNDTDDLLRDMTAPRGETLRISGHVVDTQNLPRAGVSVDIWQTDPLGRYKHPYDSTPGTRFDDFAYWGQSLTSESGHFTFRTYLPGGYSGRPAHVHYIVWQDRKRLLTSQIYFKGLAEGSGAIIKTDRPDLRKVDLKRADATDFAADFRIVI